jgi:hypothetical protein
MVHRESGFVRHDALIVTLKTVTFKPRQIDNAFLWWNAVTVMSVTASSTAKAVPLDGETCASIDLAVAQWLRSPRATSLGRQRLRAFGVSEMEIEERRRCRSSNRRLAAILRVAVTLVITRGRLEVRDRALLPASDREELIAGIAQATSLAFLSVLLANEVDSNEPYPEVDLDVGDY